MQWISSSIPNIKRNGQKKGEIEMGYVLFPSILEVGIFTKKKSINNHFSKLSVRNEHVFHSSFKINTDIVLLFSFPRQGWLPPICWFWWRRPHCRRILPTDPYTRHRGLRWTIARKAGGRIYFTSTIYLIQLKW